MSLINIGTFAADTGLSIAALRHYDEIGLLKPARVDPGTGYRRYSPDQVPRARLICGLRAVDLPIDEIRGVAGQPPPVVRAALDAHRARMVAQVRELTQQVAAVDEFIAKGTTMPAPAPVRPVQLRLAAPEVEASARFYTEAFDAVFLPEISSVRFGAFRSDLFFLVTLSPDGPRGARLGLLVADVDAAHSRALTAGGAEVHPPADFAHKPRTSCVRDPGGALIDLSQG